MSKIEITNVVEVLAGIRPIVDVRCFEATSHNAKCLAARFEKKMNKFLATAIYEGADNRADDIRDIAIRAIKQNASIPFVVQQYNEVAIEISTNREAAIQHLNLSESYKRDRFHRLDDALYKGAYAIAISILAKLGNDKEQLEQVIGKLGTNENSTGAKLYLTAETLNRYKDHQISLDRAALEKAGVDWRKEELLAQLNAQDN